MRPTQGPYELDRRNRVVQAGSGGVIAECPHKPDADRIIDLLRRDDAGAVSGGLEKIVELENKLKTMGDQLEAARREVARVETALIDKPIGAEMSSETEELKAEITRLRAELKASKKKSA